MHSELKKESAEEALQACATLSRYHYTPNPDLFLLGERWITRAERSVASVRRFVRDTADDWDAAGEAPEIAELLVSELATNAMAYGTADAPARNVIRVTVGKLGALLVVDVYDSCVEIPRMRRPSDLETSGRGLSIVEDLSHNWGWTLNPYGKSVWFQLLAWP
ncbi:ATP-binding protein [Streptosporangium sandarakinum]|uniref:ATP-binding protein n=1 Tax=Streptosporangium sandarakinum TaxID=1260955 RepID=UPI003D92C269